MKSKIISLIAIIATLAVMFVATLKVSDNVTNVEVKKAKGDETVQTGNQTEGGNAEEVKTYSFSMILNQIDKADKVNIGGNKVSITSENENVTFRVFNAVTNAEITAVEDCYAIPEQGARLQISGIKEGERNNLIIENKELVENYVATFKKLTVEVDSSDINSIRVSVKDITKLVNGEEVKTNGSEDETATFIYQEEDGTVKINNNNDLKIYYVFVANSDLAEGKTGLTDAELEEVEWQEYNKETGYKAEKNGIVYSKTKYKDGAYSTINNYIVNNVDKVAPIITLNNIIYNTNEYTAKISGTAEDGEATKDYAKSGLVGYAITLDDVEPENYLEFDNEENNFELDEIDVNGTYYVWAKDKAGNVTKRSIEVDIDFTTTEDEETKRVLILFAPNAELVGTTYKSINEFLDVLDTNNITAESGRVVAQIVNPIKSETAEFENKDIVLDLNGYEIIGRTQNSTINVKSGKLNIVDNKYDIADYISDDTKANELKTKYQANDGNGTIKSIHGIAIDIKEGSEFTLGEDGSQGFTYIEEPSQVAPYIIGNTKGVYNEGGVFNYYDGKIESVSTVDGEVTRTPNLFDPTIVLDEEKNVYVEVLERVSGIEALIGKTRYTKLEDAIAAANDIKGTPDEQIEIDVVRDLSKSESVVVDNTKNIKIDLNGFKFTNNVNDYIVKNYGKLEFIDSGNTAEIISTTSSAIYNDTGATLKMNGPKVFINKDFNWSNRCYTVYNAKDANLEIAGGELNVYAFYGYTVMNDGGNVNVTGGKIVSSGITGRNDDYATGIYNKDNGDSAGTVTVNGGEFQCNADIYNISTKGEVIINGGTFSSSYNVNCPPNSNNTEIPYKTTINGGTLNGTIYGNYGNTVAKIIVNDADYINKIFIHNGTITVNGGNVNEIEMPINSDAYDAQLAVNGGTINVIKNGKRNLNVKDATITGTIEFTYPVNAIIDNTKFERTLPQNGTYYCIKNTSNTNIDMIDCEMNIDINHEANGADYYVYGIYNSNSGKIDFKDGKINIKNNGLKTNNQAYRLYGIYNSGEGEVDVTGESEVKVYNTTDASSNNFAIYNSYIGNVVIGDKDDTYNESDVTILSDGTAIYNQAGNLKFYDGVIYTNNKYNGSINDNEKDYGIVNGTETYTLNENEISLKTIKQSKNVENVEIVETRNKYISIGAAIDAIKQMQNKTGTIKVLAEEIYETEANTHTIDNDVNVTIDLNNKTVLLGAGFNNNGTLKFKDDSDEKNANIKTKLITNNSQLSIESGNWIFELNPDVGCLNNKNGNITIKESTIKMNAPGTSARWNNIFENYGELNLNENLSISLENYSYCRAVMNYGDLNINGAVLEHNQISSTYEIIRNRKKEIKDIVKVKGYDFGYDEGYVYINGYYDDGIGDCYLEIDLSNKSSAETYNVKVAADFKGVNTETIKHKAYGVITESESVPNYVNEEKRVFLIEGEAARQEYQLAINGGKKYYLHLGNHHTGGTSARYSLRVYDIEVSNDNETIYENKAGKVTINSGEIINRGSGNGSYTALYNSDYGTKIEMNGGKIYSNTTLDTRGIINRNGSIIVNGGELNTEGIGINNANGYVEVNDGLMNENATALYQVRFSDAVPEVGLMQLNKIDIENTTSRGIHSTAGEINIVSGKIIEGGQQPILMSSTKMHITDVEIKVTTNSYGGIILEYGNDLEIDNADIDLKGMYGNTVIGVNGRDNKVQIHNADLKVEVPQNAIGIHSESTNNNIEIDDITIDAKTNGNNTSFGLDIRGSGSLKIKEGTITAIGTNGYGLYLSGEMYTTIGENELDENNNPIDEQVSRTNPLIAGTTYGIYKTAGNLYYYDGILKGNTKALSGAVADRPTEYEIIIDSEEGYNEIAYLDRIPVARIVETNTPYYNLQTAIDRCSDSEKNTIEILYNINIENKLSIDESKEIEIDMKEHTIVASTDKYIENKGKVSFKNGIIDLQKSGTNEKWNNVFENYGELNLNENLNIKLETYSYCRAVMNYGDLNINGAVLEHNQISSTYEIIRNRKKEIKDIVKVKGYDFGYDEGYVYINGYYDDGIGDCYLEIDLSNKSSAETYNVKVAADFKGVNTETIKHKAYGVITESESVPNYVNEEKRVFLIEGEAARQEYQLAINGGKKYYLHLGNHHTGGTSARYSLRVYDIEVSNDNETIYENKAGKVTINSGEIINRGSGNGSYTALYNSDYGTKIEMNGGKIYSNTTLDTRGIINRNGSIIVNGGELNTEGIGINNANGYVEVNDGLMNENATALYQVRFSDAVPEVGLMQLNKIDIENTTSRGIHSTAGEINIVSGKIIEGGQQPILMSSTKMHITDVEIKVTTNSYGGIILEYGNDLEIDNADIDLKGMYGNTVIGVNGRDNKVQIHNADLKVEVPQNAIGIHSESTNNNIEIDDITIDAKTNGNNTSFGLDIRGSGSLKIKEGTITAIGTNGYGLYSTGNTHITIGENDLDSNDEPIDASVSRVNPSFEGTTYGAYIINGSFKMYDGMFKGANDFYGPINDRPTDYELKHEEENEQKKAYLDKIYVVENIDKDKQYYTLQKAFNDCDQNENNLKVIYDINLPEETINSQTGKINLDLNNHTITSTAGKYINNKGKMKIDKGQFRQQIGGTAGEKNRIIENNGILDIEGDIDLGLNNYTYCVGILNHGELNCDDATLYSTGDYFNLIENSALKPDDVLVSTTSERVTVEDYRYSIKADYNQNTDTYFEIDLSGKPTNNEYNVLVNANAIGYIEHYSYGIITESEDIPDYTNDELAFFKIYGETSKQDYTVKVNGGKKYYLHLGVKHTGYTSATAYLKVNNIKVSNDNEVIYKGNTAKVILNNGVIKNMTTSGNHREFYGIYNYGHNSYVEINGTEFYSSNYGGDPGRAIHNIDGDIIINDINIHDEPYALYNSNGYVEINDGLIKDVGTIMYQTGLSAKFKVNNVELDKPRNNGIYVENGYVEINNIITENFDRNVLYMYQGKAIINGGSLKSNKTCIYNATNYNTDVVVKGGTIESANESAITLNYANNKLTLGNNEDGVSTISPSIKGKPYGVYKAAGTFNFYDGIITGQTDPIFGTVNETPVEYEVKINDNVATLGRSAVFENTIQLNGAYYDTIQSAINVLNSSSNKTGTIYIWNDIIREDESFTVPAGMNLTLALEGHTIEFNTTNSAITNNGTLTIVDSDDLDEIDAETESVVRNTRGTTIVNNGTLTIGRSDNPNSNSPIITGITPVSGNEPTVLSGSVRNLNVQSGALNVNDGIQVARFNFGGAYSLSTTEFSTKNIAKRIYLEAENVVTGVANRVLSSVSRITGAPELPTYTNDGVNVNIEADVIPNLDMYYTDTNVGKVKVKHVDIKTNKVLSESETTDKHGRPYETHSIDIEGYDLVETEIVNEEEVNRLPANATGTYDALNEIEVIYYYVSRATVNVKYVDVETREEIFESDYIDGHEGDTYQTTNRNIDGYMLVTEDNQGNSLLPANAEGTFRVIRDEENNITNREDDVIYYYTTKSVGINVKYVDTVHDSIIYNYHVDGTIGERYNEPVKTSSEVPALQGYNLLEEKDEINYLPDNSSGVFSDELIEIVYYFVHDYRFEVHYIDEDNNDILDPVLLNTLEGEQYSITASSIEDYVLKASPENLTGRLLRNDEISEEDVNATYGRYFLRLDFVYEPLVVMCDVNVKYVDEKTNVVLKEETIRGERNTEYTTSAERFERYDLDNERLPENATGRYKENEVIEVTYYYKRIAYVKVNYLDVDTKEEVFESEYYEGHEDDGYEVFNRNIDNYILVTEDNEGNSLLPTNAKGTYSVIRDGEGNVTSDEIEVTYYYTNKMNNIVVKYVDIVHDSEIYSYQVEGILGERYNITPETSNDRAELNGYNLVEERDGINYLPENSEGPVTENGAEIVFFYVHNYRFEVHYVDEEGNDLENPILIDTLEGERYNASAIEIADKELTTEENEYSGILEKDTVISDDKVNPTYGRYYLRIDFVYKDKVQDDPEPGNTIANNTVSNNTVVNNTIDNEVTNNTIVDNEITNNTVINNTVENEITNDIVVDNTVDNEVVNDIIVNNTIENDIINDVTVNNTIENEITNDIIVNNTIENEIINEIVVNTVDNNTIVNEPVVNTVTNTTNNTVNNEIPEDKDNKDFKVVVHYVDKSTGKKLTTDVVIEGKTGEDYLTKVKELKGYELISKTSNYKGQMTVQVVDGKETKEIHVTYYYAKKATGVLPQTGEEFMKNSLYIIGFVTCISLAIVSINQIKKEEKNDK